MKFGNIRQHERGRKNQGLLIGKIKGAVSEFRKEVLVKRYLRRGYDPALLLV